MKRHAITLLLLCLTLFGCMKERGAAEPFTGSAGTRTRSASTAPDAVCVVYVADWSKACKLLAADLNWLADKHGWSVSNNPSEPADFMLVPRRDESQSIPFLQFYLGDTLVNTHLGYSTSDDRNVRLQTLQQIVSKHPKRLR